MSGGSAGFSGSYDMPEAVLAASDEANIAEEQAALEAGTLSTAELASNAARRRNRRKLGTQAVIDNPVYCLNSGDNFMWTIAVPEHYPKYMKDSTLNSNKQFDYAAFTALGQEMRNKIA